MLVRNKVKFEAEDGNFIISFPDKIVKIDTTDIDDETEDFNNYAEEEMEIYIIIIFIAAILAFIPASIANKKGRSFGAWWLYGWLLFIVALIHALCLPDVNENTQIQNINTQSDNAFEELKKYKQLLDSGVITEDEFKQKKEQLIKLI